MMVKYRTMQDAVTEFQKAFGRFTDVDFSQTKIVLEAREMFELRRTLIEEAMTEEDETKIKKESADLLYVLTGLFVDFGWDMQVIFNRIHQSNMSKLDEDGKPVYREDGKIMKSSRYKEADLSGV